MRIANAIIAGAPKAGTSSIFEYLSAHPQVCGSSIKETAFFLRDYTGDVQQDLRFYGKYFSHCKDTKKIYLEASSGYLAGGGLAAMRIEKLLDQPKIILILRNPVERLYSYYNFLIGQLALPEEKKFEDYVELCMKKKNDSNALLELKMDDFYHLEVVEHGCYAKFIVEYLEFIPMERLWIGFYEDLKRDQQKFVSDICKFLVIDPLFYQDYTFHKVNVTFSAKHVALHKLAMKVSRGLESVLRQRPGIKLPLVKIYKKINLKREGYEGMAEATRNQLKEYYREHNNELEKILGRQLPAEWY